MIISHRCIALELTRLRLGSFFLTDDFSGFPDEYYKQTFQSRSDPMLADRLIKMYKEKKVAALPKARGLDQ